MGVMLIVLVIFMIAGAVFGYFEEDSRFFGALMAGLVGIIPSFLIGGMISLALFGTTPLVCSYSQNLVALKDNTSVSGSFFLGCGNIDSKTSYVYAVETEKGITTVTIDQDSYKIYIRYTNDQPRVEYWNGINDWWRLPEESPYYVFYLPEGSVINTYQIDLE